MIINKVNELIGYEGVAVLCSGVKERTIRIALKYHTLVYLDEDTRIWGAKGQYNDIYIVVLDTYNTENLSKALPQDQVLSVIDWQLFDTYEYTWSRLVANGEDLKKNMAKEFNFDLVLIHGREEQLGL